MRGKFQINGEFCKIIIIFVNFNFQINVEGLKFCDVKDNYVLMYMDICFLMYIRNGGFMVMEIVNEICK